MTQRATQTPLKRVIEEEGRRQVWLAERAGLSTTRLSLIVNGLHPRDDEAQAIAAALGRNTSDLFEQVAA